MEVDLEALSVVVVMEDTAGEEECSTRTARDCTIPECTAIDMEVDLEEWAVDQGT